MANISNYDTTKELVHNPHLQRVTSTESSTGTVSTLGESPSDCPSVPWPAYIGWQPDGSLDPIFHTWALPFACQAQQGDLALPNPDEPCLQAYAPDAAFGGPTSELMKIHLENTAVRKERRREQNRKAQQAYRARKEQQILDLQMLLQQASEACRKQNSEANTLRETLTRLKEERAWLLANSNNEDPDIDPLATGREFLQVAERLLQLHRQESQD